MTNWKCFFYFFFIFSMAFSSNGEVIRRKKVKKKRVASLIKSTLTSDTVLDFQTPTISTVNPNNRVLKTPNQNAEIDLKAQINWEYRKKVRLVVKAHQRVTSSKAKLTSPTATESVQEFPGDFREIYIESLSQKNFNARIGYLTYEWGPAEIFTPSNALFHFSKSQQFPFYQRKGYALLDLIYNFSESDNLQLLQEFKENNETPWINGVEFNPRLLLKFEHAFENSFNYIGVTAGRAERERTFEGLYLNAVPYEGYSIYFDGRQTHGSLGYHPHLLFGNQYRLDLRDDPSKLYKLWVAGFRFEGDFDWRLEWLHNDEGYDAAEYDHWILALGQNQFYGALNGLRSQQSGLEFISRDYRIFSVRMPDILWKNQMSVSFRILESVTTPSRLNMVSLETPIGDSGTLNFYYFKGDGKKTSEFLFQSENRFLMNMKWTHL